MDFNLDADQSVIRDSLQALLQAEFPFARRRDVVAGDHGWDPALWDRLADLGYLGLFLGEQRGGGDGGAVESLIIMQALGESLCVEPYLVTAILAPILMSQAPAASRSSPFWRELSAGRVRIATTPQVLGATRTAAHGSVPRLDPDRGALSGTLLNCLGAAGATHFLVPYDPGLPGGSEPWLALIPAKAVGLGIHTYRMHDGTRAADITLAGVVATEPDVITLNPSSASQERAEHFATLGLCAEAVGCMERLLWQTVDFTKARKQFGTSISSFQVLQHAMADMWMLVEQSSALVYGAAGLLAQHDPTAPRTLIAARAFVVRAARSVSQKAVQLHGGIGLTTTLAAGQYFKRLTMIGQLLGPAEEHEMRFAADLLEAPT